MTQVAKVDSLNIAFIIICVALAYILPFELILLSYAILGPAHYLTQINWLNDRGYFVEGRDFLYIGIGFTLLAILIPSFSGASILSALTLAILYIAKVRLKWAIVVTAFLFLIYESIFKDIEPMHLIFAVLLPTVIHVYIFTFVFMLVGALKSNSRLGLIAAGMMPVAGALFFLIPPSEIVWNSNFIQSNGDAFSHIFKKSFEYMNIQEYQTLMVSAMGFLSFAYTYHYLNWFSKMDIIRWHHVTPSRWFVMGTIYIGALGIYFYDYKLGMAVLLFLSLLHVILEFPLNGVSFRELYKYSKIVKI